MRISIDGNAVDAVSFTGGEPEFNYGYGAFETVRTYHGLPFHLSDHLARLRTSAAEIQLHVPAQDKQIQNWVLEHCTTTEDRRIKIIAASEHVYILSEPLIINAAGQTAGITLQLTRLERRLPHAKLLNYADEYLAHRMAQDHGYDDALLMTAQQEIREAAFANFFIVKNDVIITPHHHILLGITREIVLRLARQQHAVKERPLSLDEVMLSAEAFITQTTTGILPVTHIDRHVIGSGQPGKVTKQLIQQFTEYAATYAL